MNVRAGAACDARAARGAHLSAMEMLLPFKIPHAGLQSLRQRLFYWRVVYWYRFAQQHDLYNRK